MTIRVKCERPKYAAGELEFSRFEDVLNWLVKIRGLGKDAPGRWFYGLAKTGCAVSSTARHSIQIKSDFSNYSLAQEVASNTSLLRTRWGSEIIKPDRKAALAFAQELDRRLSALSA